MKTNPEYSKALREAHTAVNSAYEVVLRADAYGQSPIREAARYSLNVAEGVLDSVRALDIPLRA